MVISLLPVSVMPSHKPDFLALSTTKKYSWCCIQTDQPILSVAKKKKKTREIMLHSYCAPVAFLNN